MLINHGDEVFKRVCFTLIVHLFLFRASSFPIYYEQSSYEGGAVLSRVTMEGGDRKNYSGFVGVVRPGY
jgi:hypothetical protein